MTIRSLCAICSEMKPYKEVTRIGKYLICDECYNTKIDDLPKDVKIKVPKGIELYGVAAYFPLVGEIHVFKKFNEFRCESIISHEVFHTVLLKHVGWEACLMWDNVSGDGELEYEFYDSCD